MYILKAINTVIIDQSLTIVMFQVIQGRLGI